MSFNLVDETFDVSEATEQRAKRSARYNADLKEAAELVGAAFDGNRRKLLDLQEALTTSDFPVLFGDVLDRQLIKEYSLRPSVWSKYADRTVVPNFKPKKLVDLFGGRQLLSEVPEHTEYPTDKIGAEEHSLSVGKLGKRFAITWEDIVNDDLDGLRTLPSRLADSAVLTEDDRAARALVNSKGINTDFFKAANKNVITGNPALTADALSDALQMNSEKVDVDGNPIYVEQSLLVIPPALKRQAQRILNATEIRYTDPDTGKVTITGNDLAGSVQLVVVPNIQTIVTGAKGKTSWFLLPPVGSGRPAVAQGFLRGHESPDLRMKADAGTRVGGGAISGTEGSFDIDDIQYRVRHVIGATTVLATATAASDGSGK